MTERRATPRPFVTIVSGFGRCGSSLVMQMLDAGGMRCAGIFPSFEDAAVTPGAVSTINAEWFAEQRGGAVKVLDPHICRPPNGVPIRAIWLDRDHRDQAASHAKFMHLIFGVHVDRESRRRMERSYSRDRPAAVRAIIAAGAPSILGLRFEDVLSDPAAAVWQINYYLGGGLDVAAMAGQVRRRGPECQPGMDLELRLIEERNAL